MVNKILEIKEKEAFDFRKYACPHDDLSYLFPEWVEYYRMKYAICKAIEPKSILETGVRYGYSAITFLQAAKSASYLGIDNNSATFGGVVDAIEWAKKITRDYQADFLLADTQKMTSFPGDYYDFIHIDAQQDGDGTYHDLEMALQKGRYILADGYFWSKENMLSASYFLEKYRNFIDYALMIPGYAGELLIRTKANAKDVFSSCDRQKTYHLLKENYNTAYYLNDCGGYDAFKKTGGKELEDSRLLSMYYLSDPRPGETILDVGCGRGELSFALARAGAKVTGIDYSADSIEIAKKMSYETQEGMSEVQLNFVEGDFLEVTFDGKFDKVVAADLVEHIDRDSLEKMFKKISHLLKKDGIFVLHTFPNKLYYDYGYEKKREVVRKVGLYMPRNPRTYYEDLMHINEQTPAVLRRNLKKYFDCVVVWVATLPDIGGSLARGITRSTLTDSTSIFAIASQRTVDAAEVLALIEQPRLDPEKVDIEVEVVDREISMKRSEANKMMVTIRNNGDERFTSLPPSPVYISYHWVNGEGEFEVFEGLRTPIRTPLLPSEQREFTIDVVPPRDEGQYVLQITLVQEDNFWFENAVANLPVKVEVEVL
jgi:2-polyprenyl-3-methyl-5-hydroxy-6-metoxy-1,4-benzoquinol methylase